MNKAEQSEHQLLPKADTRLQKRAQRLAIPVDDTALNEQSEWLTFRLADKTYALNSRFLVSVGAYRQMTPLMLYDGLVRGVVNSQGSILGILDLQQALGLEPQEVELASGAMLIIGRQQAEWGLAVSQILDILTISAADEQQGRLGNKEMSGDELILGLLQSGIWLLNGQILLNRMDKLVGR